MKDEFLVTLLTSSGEKQCLQKFRNVVMCFNKAFRDCDTVVRTQCWNLKGPNARNNADDVRESLENSDLVICVVDPSVTEGVRDDIVQALDWVRESFQMAFFAVKERNMYIYVKEASASGTGSRQAQRAVSFLETLYKKGYNPITYPTENAFALTLLYQLCNMVRSELWSCDFPRENGFDLGDIFSVDGIAEFGINFYDLPWVKNFQEYNDIKRECVSLGKALVSERNKYATALALVQKDELKKKMEDELLHSYWLLCRFYCRQNTPEIIETMSAFLNGNIALANKNLNTSKLLRRISAYRKDPSGLKNAGGTKMEFDYLLNCYLLKIHLLQTLEPLEPTDTEEELYNNVLSLSQGLVTFVEQMGINDEASGFFFSRDKLPQAKAQSESSMRIFQSFSKEKQKKTLILGINAYVDTAICLEKELEDVRMIPGQNLPRKTISALKTIRVLYEKALSLITPLLKRYPKSYWPEFADIYGDLYGFLINTGQIHRADRLSEETHLMVSKLGVTCPCTSQGQPIKDTSDKNTDRSQVTSQATEEYNQKEPAVISPTKGINFTRLLDKVECLIDLNFGELDRAQRRIPKGIEAYIRPVGSDPNKVEKDLFAWIDSEEVLPDVFSVLRWANTQSKEVSEAPEAIKTNNTTKTAHTITEDIANEAFKDKRDKRVSELPTAQSNASLESQIVYEEGLDSGGWSSYMKWDISQILVNQATIYSLKGDHIKSIKYAVAAIESINQRLGKNPSLILILDMAIRVLREGYSLIGKIAEAYECMLQLFNLHLPDFKRDLVTNYDIVKNQVFDYQQCLSIVPEDRWSSISSELVGMVRDFIFENFALSTTKRVYWILKAFLKFYQKIELTAEIEKTQDKIQKVEAIIENQTKTTKELGDLFGGGH